MLRDPHGGVENVAEQAGAGMKWLSLNVADHAPAEWLLVRSRAREAGVVCLPKARLGIPDRGDTRAMALAKLEFLCHTAVDWETDLAVVNAETEIKRPELGGLVTPDDVADALDRYQLAGAALSTESWLYAFDTPDHSWQPLLRWPILLQLYPEDGRFDPANMATELATRVRRARAYGFTYVGVTYQAWRADPDWYDRTGHAWSLAFGDDVGIGNWWRWN